MPRQSQIKVWIPVIVFETDLGEVAYETPECLGSWASADLRRLAEADLWKTFRTTVGEVPACLTWVRAAVDLPTRTRAG